MIEKVTHWGKGAPRRKSKSAVRQAFALNRKPWVCDGCGKAWAGDRHELSCCSRGQFHRRRIFSLSLGDWLDPEVPIQWLAEMLDTIRQCDQCDWLLLTKRPELFSKRMDAVVNYLAGLWNKGDKRADLLSWINGWNTYDNPRDNIWIGASVEDQPCKKRIAEVLQIPAKVHFLSCEPLLEDLGKLDLNGIDQVIVGGESGPSARTCNVEWIRSIKDQCKTAGVPCFVKQDSGPRSGMQGRLPDELFNTKEFPSI